MNIKLDFNNIKVKEQKKDFTVKILMLKGEQGKSAYQVAVDNGYTGTEEEFVNSYINATNYYNKTEVDTKLLENLGYRKVTPQNISNIYPTITKNIILTDGNYGNITVVENSNLVGETLNAKIEGNLYITKNITLKNLTIGGNNSTFTTLENEISCYNILVEGCYITKGSTSSSNGGGFWCNDTNLSYVEFRNCEFAYCNSNGIKLTHKGTNGAIHDIQINNCYFHNNERMNFEIIGRAETTDTVNYYNVNINNSRFENTDNNINVSYDGKVDIKDGYSQFKNNIINQTSNYYGFEIAGACNMLVENNEINGIISCSQFSLLQKSFNKFLNNKIYGYASFKGGYSTIQNNNFFDTISLEYGYYSNISNNIFKIDNYVSGNDYAVIHIRSSKFVTIVENKFISTLETVDSKMLLVRWQYAPTTNGIFANNKIYGQYYEISSNDLDANNNLSINNFYENYKIDKELINCVVDTKTGRGRTTGGDLFYSTDFPNLTSSEITCKYKIEIFGRENNNHILENYEVAFGTYNNFSSPIITRTDNISSAINLTVVLNNETNKWDFTYTDTNSGKSLNIIITLISSIKKKQYIEQ